MRIVGGEFKGRPLASPAGAETRPTADAQRQAIFNILNNSLAHGCEHTLDLFAGTGALALEAMSWGAQSCVFVESSKKALDCLRKNLEQCRIGADRFAIIEKDKLEQWARLLTALGEKFTPFDTVFCDPPYRKGLVAKTLLALEKAAASLFVPGRTLLVVEIASEESVPKLPPAWNLIKERSKGSTCLLFYRRRANVD